MDKIKGKTLKKGDTIGICAPSGALNGGQTAPKAKEALEKLGYKVILGPSCFEQYGYLSGNDEVRAQDLNNMFSSKNIDGIVCLRGGYGTPRILDKINYDMIKNNPKLFMGFSDITGLLTSINQKTGLVVFHGPMATSHEVYNNIESFTLKQFKNYLCSKKPYEYLENPKDRKIEVLKEGICEGEIIGGNLSLIVSTLGSEYEIDTKNKILFIEEINEYTYRVDRMLTSLRLAGKFKDCNGVIFGDFNNCDNEKDGYSLSLIQVFKDVLEDFSKPVIFNLSAGHCKDKLVIPIGANLRVDTFSKKIGINEDLLV